MSAFLHDARSDTPYYSCTFNGLKFWQFAKAIMDAAEVIAPADVADFVAVADVLRCVESWMHHEKRQHYAEYLHEEGYENAGSLREAMLHGSE